MSDMNWTEALSHEDALTELEKGAPAIKIITRYRGSEETFVAFTNALAQNHTCTHLGLPFNGIGPDGTKQIGDALKLVSILTSLDLRNNSIRDEGAKELAEALKVSTSLTELILASNNIGHVGAKEIAVALQENTSLTSLDLRYNGIGDEGAKRVADALKDNSSLTSLSLWNNNIGVEGAKSIANTLNANNGLTLLNLRYNEIGDEGAKEFAEALKVNTSLTELILASNSIGHVGAKEIAVALQENTSLTSLDFDNNPIGPDGAKEIAVALQENTSLISLNLHHNEIGDEGAKEFAEALKVNTSLTELILASNSIGHVGAKEIAIVLQENTSLTSLDLGRNERIRFDGAKEIADALKANPMSALIRLRCSGNAEAFVKKRNRQRFLDTLNGNEKAVFGRLRVMLVGQGKAGKSATVRSILGKPFRPGWDSTIGADVSESTISGSEWGDEKDRIDFASALAIKMMNPLNSSAIVEKKNLPVASPVDAQTLPKIAKSEIHSKTEIIKKDQAKKSPREDIIREYDDTMMLKAYGRKNDLALSLWDFGGQEVFYTMHHIFLTKTGVYILVFDTRELLDLNTKAESNRYLMFWLRSINIHAPNASLLLVGTFCAETQGKIRNVDKILRELSKQFSSQIVTNENLVYFAIDNRERLNIQKLRKAIELTARNDPAMKQEVSIRWMAFLDELLSHKKSKSYLTLNGDVSHIACKLGLSRHEQEIALGLFHERGLIIRLTATETLRNIVVINPQWLIDALGKVIRDSSIHVDMTQYESDGLREDAQLLFLKGIASRDLLGYLWKYDQTEFFIDLMKRTMLMSEYQDDRFLIPSLLKKNTDVIAIDRRCVIDFSATFLPHGVFQRLVCLCVEYVSRKTALDDSIRMSKNCAQFSAFAGHEVELVEDPSRQAILVSSSDIEKVVRILSSMLLKINGNVMGGRLKYKVLVDGKELQPQKTLDIQPRTLDIDLFLDSLD